ncbi:MAG: hypothetical protein HY072_09255, partial [Deltaproteobacteria bacterium]|nr:hypothetical protein [Deltaproteobacteria bacterium]
MKKQKGNLIYKIYFALFVVLAGLLAFFLKNHWGNFADVLVADNTPAWDQEKIDARDAQERAMDQGLDRRQYTQDTQTTQDNPDTSTPSSDYPDSIDPNQSQYDYSSQLNQSTLDYLNNFANQYDQSFSQEATKPNNTSSSNNTTTAKPSTTEIQPKQTTPTENSPATTKIPEITAIPEVTEIPELKAIPEVKSVQEIQKDLTATAEKKFEK